MEEQWKRIQPAIKEATEGTIQEQKPIRKENWFDEEYVKITAEKNIARQKMLKKKLGQTQEDTRN